MRIGLRSAVVWVATVLTVVAAPGLESAMRTVHVFVALADNQSQGIVPVAATLGNGKTRNAISTGDRRMA